MLDRAIAAVAPVYGFNRAAHRAAIRAMAGGGYDGAAVGRRTGGWFASNGSANAITRSPLPQLRARSRDIVRNTWWGAKIKRTICGHAVGYGVTPVFKTSTKSLNRKAADLFAEWSRGCDADGQLDFNGLSALACDCVIESGETLAQFMPLRGGANKVPLEIKLYEPDHLDSVRDQAFGAAVIDQGIEYTADGKRAAFWLLPQHPGNAQVFDRGPSRRVPAADVLHVYRKDRIGQGRGVPWVAPVILKGRDIADLEEAVVVKARIEACLAAFVKTNDATRTLAQSTQTEARTSRRLETLSPGMVFYGEPGEELTTINPSSSMAFESVLVAAWFTLAAGAGITYDQLTGDHRQSNFSSLKAGKIEFRRAIEQFQWLTLRAMWFDPLLDRFVSAAQDIGALPRRAHGYPREWIFPAWEPIDPIKELQADIMAVRAGRLTWANFVAGWGFEPEAQLDEIERWLKEIDARGIALDADPRRIFKGAGQVADPAAPAGGG
jgi:lambda family phage portal protein